jgi:hypothetical protein
MPHWRSGKLASESELDGRDDYVPVVDKLPKVPPSQFVFLRYDPHEQERLHG